MPVGRLMCELGVQELTSDQRRIPEMITITLDELREKETVDKDEDQGVNQELQNLEIWEERSRDTDQERAATEEEKRYVSCPDQARTPEKAPLC